ncbi:hypothetical protein [Fusobacterium polymorphum]|uniref:hypothetical protein n=1 Tax=Fusobacterium nucleatum subsp. polymorphum TaxID=76857 RepID=UPI00300AD76B
MNEFDETLIRRSVYSVFIFFLSILPIIGMIAIIIETRRANKEKNKSKKDNFLENFMWILISSVFSILLYILLRSYIYF